MNITSLDVKTALIAQQQFIDEVEQRAGKVRILSTLPYHKSDLWLRIVDLIAPLKQSRISSKIGIPDLSLIYRILFKAHRYDVVVLTGGERCDLIYVAIAGLCPWINAPHVIADAHWQKSSGAAYFLQKMLLFMSRRLVVQIQPHSQEEEVIYSEIFKIPLKLLKAVPWSTSLIGHNTSGEVGDEKFILTGGFSFRAYKVLFAAITQCNFKLKVGLPKNNESLAIIEMAKNYSNIEIYTDWTNADYTEQIKKCRVFALPIQQGLNRSTADQTILNAMYFAKPVVVSDCIGTSIYISDGENGFIVRNPTVQEWVEKLTQAFELSPQAYAALGAKASFDAKVTFNEPIKIARTLKSALDACAISS